MKEEKRKKKVQRMKIKRRQQSKETKRIIKVCKKWKIDCEVS